MALLLVMLKAIVEIAEMALMVQFIVGAFAWGRRHENAVYRVLAVVTKPFVKITRLITPRFIVDTYVPLATFLLLAVVWAALILQLRSTCLSDLTQNGCQALQKLHSADKN